MFSHKTMSAALASVFGAKLVSRINGRLIAINRCRGWPYGRPGRGKVISYSIDDIYEQGFALTLLDFGIIPNVAASIMDKTYQGLENCRGGNIIIAIRHSVLSGETECFVVSSVADASDAILINLTELKRKIDDALFRASV